MFTKTQPKTLERASHKPKRPCCNQAYRWNQGFKFFAQADSVTIQR